MDLQKVTNNRKKVMQKMIKGNDQAKNPFYLAAYFQIPFKQAASEVEKILPGNDQFPVFDLDDLTRNVNARNAKMQQMQESGKSKDEIMEKFGMWHWPFDVMETDKIESVTLSDSKYPVKYAISDYEMDPSSENMQKLITCARNRLDRVDTYLYLTQHGIKTVELEMSTNHDSVVRGVAKALDMERVFHAKSEVRSAIISLKKEYSLEQLEKYTGVSASLIYHIKTIQQEPKSIFSEAQQKKIELIDKVWQLYTNGGKDHTEGLKQEEIAQMFGITRHTVSSYLRQYKTMHPEAVDHSQLLRPRHTGLSKKQYKDEKYPVFAKSYQSLREQGENHWDALSKAAKEHNTTIYHIRRAAVQAGYYVPQQTLAPVQLDQAAEFAKEGFQSSQTGTPATRKILLKNDNIKTSKEKNTLETVRIFVENRQRDSMDMVRSGVDTKSEFLKEGDLKAAMPKNKIKFGQQPSTEEEFIYNERG